MDKLLRVAGMIFVLLLLGLGKAFLRAQLGVQFPSLWAQGAYDITVCFLYLAVLALWRHGLSPGGNNDH